MIATQRCPFPAAWTPRQIAEAVPHRLHELDFGLPRFGASAGPGRRVPEGGYLPRPGLSPRFRING